MSPIIFGQGVTDMRLFPDPESEIVSQVLFYEEATLLECKGDWGKIRTQDKYEGWVSLCTFEFKKEWHVATHKVSSFCALVFKEMSHRKGPVDRFPYGVSLLVVEEKDGWQKVKLPNGKFIYIRSGDTAEELPLLNPHAFLDIPYSWGGRSSLGTDCSGFVQMFYPLPRDVKDMLKDPRLKGIEEGAFGDLVFFGTTHVGFCLGEGEMIHAWGNPRCPRVTRSKVTDVALPHTFYRYQKELM